MTSNGKAVDPWRTKPLQIADLAWQVHDVYLIFFYVKALQQSFASKDISNILSKFWKYAI